jgi:hypothetical protein
MYEKAAKLNQGLSNAVTPWLDGFARDQGVERARYFLQGVGIVEPKTSIEDPEM